MGIAFQSRDIAPVTITVDRVSANDKMKENAEEKM